MMQEKNMSLLTSAFKKYYFDNFDLIRVPDRAREREFGYQKFDSGMIRHISLKNNNELHLMLINNVPSDVYCSNGYYTFPNLPMAEKDWKAADLIFDIDAKDLKLDCRSRHVCQKCTICNTTFQNSKLCIQCGSNKIISKSFPCNNCIDMAKIEVDKLCKILADDLGIIQEHISVYFSGNEGFHIHITNSGYQELGSRERSELFDYVSFRNIMPETLGMKKNNPSRKDFPEFDDLGWRGRAAKHLFGSKSARSKAISEILKGGYVTFENTLREIAPRVGAVVDSNVTTDIHRIFRLAGTLNSKSGLTKMACEDIKKFNPYDDACLVDDTPVMVMADCPVSFKLKNSKFGPYNDTVQMPRYAAVYLICKGFATCV